MATYTTSQGDTFDSIAFKQLGSENYMKELIECNYQYRKYVVFPANIVLQLPTIEESAQDNLNLPPWKR